ncbi:MAG TPA: LapA family protein [Pseudolabrys sp.]|nr:LapA family protein [Pseudolabrys sp.]
MFRKIITALIVIPLAVIGIGFAVANRQPVTISFDPFSAANPAYSATLPLFVLIFLLLIAGVLIGGIATWFGQAKWRRAARKLDSDVRLLHQEIDGMRRRYSTDMPRGSVDPAPYGAIPPPVP